MTFVRFPSTFRSAVLVLTLALPTVPTFGQGGDPGQSVDVTIRAVSAKGVGEPVAKATLTEVKEGLQFVVTTSKIPAGPHGFHVHETGSCEPKEKDGKLEAAGAAGSHYDPQKTGRHAGPGRGGYKGDLPLLNVQREGVEQRISFTVTGLTLKDVRGRSLIIHEGGDTYSDEPPLGGGGARIACGVIP